MVTYTSNFRDRTKHLTGNPQAGAEAYSQPFESEADYLGTYYAARAGYNVSEAANFWRRVDIEHPKAIHANHDSSHPSTAERFIRIEEAAEEIAHKLENNLQLVPEIEAK